MRPGGSGTSRMIDSAVTLLPQPHSPTIASVLPRLDANETPSTAANSRRRRSGSTVLQAFDGEQWPVAGMRRAAASWHPAGTTSGEMSACERAPSRAGAPSASARRCASSSSGRAAGVVHGHDAAVLDHLLAVHEDVCAPRGRPPHRSGCGSGRASAASTGCGDVDQHHVGLGAHREPADVARAERSRAAERRGIEDVAWCAGRRGSRPRCARHRARCASPRACCADRCRCRCRYSRRAAR